MTKIVLNGAGSAEFTKELLADILGFEDLAGATIALFDVDGERLETAAAIARWTAQALGAQATIEPYRDRRAALAGADHVISMIRVGGHEALRRDFEIPGRHGVRQAMGDTMGIGSIFRALCTIPALLELARDLREVAPDAWLYNYTNPMAALVWAIYAGTAHQRVVGVCMSPENTAGQLAEIVGVPFEQLTYVAGGINHQSWILRLERHGQDLYPRLREIVDSDPGRLGRRVRVEICKRFGFFPTESSEHNADLVPWFLPHDDQVSHFRIPVNEYLRRSERNLGGYAEIQRKLAAGEPLELERGWEYAPQIIHSIETGTRRMIYGNVRNGGSVANLPEDCCVEVPCLVDRAGVQPTRVGSLPPQLAALNRWYLNVCELTVRAALEERRDLVYQAALLDPVTAASLPADEIVQLCDELIEAHGALIPAGIRAG
ncbi:MAG: alpha-glucosidase/alpha-galactosidase [Actinobacteria bacterium]|nr:alpha-glucosidase/alpha-galactosidase [Actinomycetota bacterium]